MVGTDFGLNHFDGVPFRKMVSPTGDSGPTFPTRSIPSLKTNSTGLAGTDNGYLWFDMHRGFFIHTASQQQVPG